MIAGLTGENSVPMLRLLEFWGTPNAASIGRGTRSAIATPTPTSVLRRMTRIVEREMCRRLLSRDFSSRSRSRFVVPLRGWLLKHFGCAVALLMLTCGAAPANDAKIKTLNKNSNVTIKRGVVTGDDSFNQWLNGSKHPRRFELSPK